MAVLVVLYSETEKPEDAVEYVDALVLALAHEHCNVIPVGTKSRELWAGSGSHNTAGF